MQKIGLEPIMSNPTSIRLRATVVDVHSNPQPRMSATSITSAYHLFKTTSSTGSGREGSRTLTHISARDFKSPMSAYSITHPYLLSAIPNDSFDYSYLAGHFYHLYHDPFCIRSDMGNGYPLRSTAHTQCVPPSRGGTQTPSRLLSFFEKLSNSPSLTTLTSRLVQTVGVKPTFTDIPIERS